MLIIELLLIILWVYLYFSFDNNKSKLIAYTNTQRIINYEKKYGFFWESSIQNYILQKCNYIYNLLNYTYLFNHLSTSLLLFLYILLIENEMNHQIKLVFYFCNGIGLFIQKKFPAAPPRLINYDENHKIIANDITFFEKKINIYGCMPSLHIVYALWVAHSLYNMFGITYIFIHPIITSLCIIITGHHYFLDIIIGCLVYFISNLLQMLLTKTVSDYNYILLEYY